jgi:hypothetical protein
MKATQRAPMTVMAQALAVRLVSYVKTEEYA